MRATILSALLTAVLSIASSVGAATYYVATTGNDGNAGTSGSPWRTMGKAAATMLPGDTAIVANGTYEEPEILFQRNGTATQPITLKAANKWSAILSSTSGCHPAISLYASYITIEDLHITLSPNNVTCTTGTIANSSIRAWELTLPTSTNPTTGYQGFVARGLLVDYSPNRVLGIKTNQDFSLIENNVLHIETETFNTNGTIIRNNVYDQGSSPASYIGSKGGSRNTQIYGNVIHVQNGQYGILLGGASCGGCTFESSGVECYNCVAYNNVIINETGNTFPLLVMRGAQNSAFFNNVAIGGTMYMYLGGGSPGTNANPTWKNNIMDCQGRAALDSWDGYWSGTLTVDYNEFYNCTGVPSQTHAITGNPLFVNLASDWHLQAGSPAIGTGTPVTMAAYGGGTIDVSHDANGTLRTVLWDLGIYASSGSAPPPPPPPPDTTPAGS